jgi:hydrogenase expression/formation protein HypD
MKYSDEYRDPALVEGLYQRVLDAASGIEKTVTIMEICGTHTHAIGRFGIKSRLPENVRLISGPGCPVCVTAVEDIDRSLSMARLSGVILTTFGDMIRQGFCLGPGQAEYNT